MLFHPRSFCSQRNLTNIGWSEMRRCSRQVLSCVRESVKSRRNDLSATDAKSNKKRQNMCEWCMFIVFSCITWIFNVEMLSSLSWHPICLFFFATEVSKIRRERTIQGLWKKITEPCKENSCLPECLDSAVGSILRFSEKGHFALHFLLQGVNLSLCLVLNMKSPMLHGNQWTVEIHLIRSMWFSWLE